MPRLQESLHIKSTNAVIDPDQVTLILLTVTPTLLTVFLILLTVTTTQARKLRGQHSAPLLQALLHTRFTNIAENQEQVPFRLVAHLLTGKVITTEGQSSQRERLLSSGQALQQNMFTVEDIVVPDRLLDHTPKCGSLGAVMLRRLRSELRLLVSHTTNISITTTTMNDLGRS